MTPKLPSNLRWKLASETLALLADAQTLDEFSTFAAGSFRKLFEADFVTCDTFGKNAHLLSSKTSPEEFASANAYQRLAEPFRQHVGEHPLLARGLWGIFIRGELIMQLSDFTSLRAFQRTGLYNEVYKHQGFRFQLCVGAEIDGNRVWTAGCGRYGRDYRSYDRDLLRFCQPLITSVLKSVARREQVSLAASFFRSFISDVQHPHVIVDFNGTLTGGSPSGLRKLGVPTEISFEKALTLPPALKATWHELRTRKRMGHNATFRLLHEASAGPTLLLWLSAETAALVFDGERAITKPDARASLSRRERDVLVWLAEGKSNADIGLILKLSKRTIEKHCESIFSKLGVENRLSAALVARDLAL